MLINEEQKQSIINAAYFLAQGANELRNINGLLARNIAAQAEALLEAVNTEPQQNQNSQEPEISQEVLDLVDEFNDILE